jgi:hypothetical protein
VGGLRGQRCRADGGHPRADVGPHGFDATIALSRETHTLYAYAINVPGTSGHNPLLWSRSVTIP